MARPSSVWFEARGSVEACPTAWNREESYSGARSCRKRTADAARAVDSSQFDGNFRVPIGRSSVCPDTTTDPTSRLSRFASSRSTVRDGLRRRARPVRNINESAMTT